MSHTTTLNQLRNTIRHGLEPEQPQLFQLWFSIEDEHIENTQVDAWHANINQFQLLLDTFADVIIPSQWRWQCLDHIQRPLIRLSRLVSNANQQQQLKQLLTELRVTSHYFK
ncbi:hypothetical protein MHM98_07450 [Psychrobium sp. MM17-31]|uniref:hypothetical protein n=1 Tax=Psychrobium sp. MM17-31 TaxID=2917758 RepID=UPI001EF71ABA|nr:hypothetical protein [Psychrobium sp. MM17-31]MCG7531187.1 hypothetical protein [Psychrobium sp. MM17-31]